MKAELKPSKLQLYSFLASMPIIDFVLNYILFDERIFVDANIWFYSFPLIFLIGIGSWRSQAGIQNWIQYKFPAIKQTHSRVLLLVLIIIPFMSFSVLFIFYIYDYFHFLGYELRKEDLQYGLLAGFSVNLIFV